MSLGSKQPKRVVFEVQREEEQRRQERLRQDLYEIHFCPCLSLFSETATINNNRRQEDVKLMWQHG